MLNIKKKKLINTVFLGFKVNLILVHKIVNAKLFMSEGYFIHS